MAINWYRYASPATFLPVAERLAPVVRRAAALLALAGLYVGFVVAPTDATQGEAYRIIYVHVPTAWMAMFVYLVMAFWSALALAFNTRCRR
jgi:heme exporter protein C